MVFMDSDEELFLTKLFSPEVLEHNYFSIGCIIGQVANDLESDPQNSLQEDFKAIVSEGNIKEGQTSDPRKTSADRRMIAIVDDEEFDRNLKGERHHKYRKIHN